MRLLNNFNNESGITELAATNEENFGLDTAFGRKQYFDTVLDNPDFTKYDADLISMRLGDVGKDMTYNHLKEMADTSSGELGLMHSIESSVDKGLKRFNGSLSQNLSERAQLKHEDFELNTPDKLDFNTHDMPIISENDYDLQAATSYIFEKLLDSGIPESDLNHAMAAGGIGDNRATIEAFHELAQDNNIPLTDYIQDVDQAYVNIQITDAIENVVPAIGTVIDAPELAMNDDRYEQEFTPIRAMSI